MLSDYQPVIEWLLTSNEPWVVYNTLVDLAGAAPGDPEARAAYRAMQQHPRVAALAGAIDSWPPPRPMSRPYDPGSSLWKLATLADFGLRRDDPRIEAIAERVFAAQTESNAFLHGGFDYTRQWNDRPYICITHVMTYALARFGYLGDLRLECAYAHIQAWQRPDGGWHPDRPLLPGEVGEEEPSCPFGTLNVLRALAQHPFLSQGPLAARAVAYLLGCWQRRAVPHRPVGFGIGSTWGQIEYPFVQYQALKTIDTLAQIPAARDDPRFREMLALLEARQDGAGRWRADNVDKAWNGFDFNQKKKASAWITFLAVRALVRAQPQPATAAGETAVAG
jgi:hypothetical protein